MLRARTIAFIAAIATLMGGCSVYNLQELRQTEPTGTPFQKALAKQYMDFAIEKERRYDWNNSMYFAGKGLQAAYGKDVAPEDLKDWNIPADKLPAMERARAELAASLNATSLEVRPEAAAEAQVNFDCWVEYQEANWQTEDITACHDRFEAALNQLSGLQPSRHKETAKSAAIKSAKTPAVKAKPKAKPVAVLPDDAEDEAPAAKVELKTEPKAEAKAEPKAEVKAEPKAEPKAEVKEAVIAKPPIKDEPKFVAKEESKSEQTDAKADSKKPDADAKTDGKKTATETASYVILFTDGAPNLSDADKKVLGEVSTSAKRAGSYDIVLHGHADAASDKNGLGRKRLDAVKQYLQADGIPDDNIRLASKSEDAKKPVARRIEIFLNE